MRTRKAPKSSRAGPRQLSIRFVSRHLAGEGDGRFHAGTPRAPESGNRPSLRSTRPQSGHEGRDDFHGRARDDCFGRSTWAWVLPSHALPGLRRGFIASSTRCWASTPRSSPTSRICPYTRAVIEETSSSLPPGPAPAAAGGTRRQDRRCVGGEGRRSCWSCRGSCIGRLTSGTSLTVSCRSASWADRPPPYTYVPFAAGPRICAGLAFGLTEATFMPRDARPALQAPLGPGRHGSSRSAA